MRQICFYLPQFHPIPENDRWWGEGFTEWTNVRKASPLFPGHYQPHVPEGVGYYDLLDAEVRNAQAELARAHGIHGFCYYHYWFNGKQLLETPFEQVLHSGQPDFPFCLCWANENWTRRWDGSDNEILVAQNYSHEDDRRFIESLMPAFRDERYIRVNGKPLLLVYCTDLLPHPKRTAEIWRELMHRHGIGDIYLARVERHVHDPKTDPTLIGFDAAVEYAPCWGSLGPKVGGGTPLTDGVANSSQSLYEYENCLYNMLGREAPDYKLFRGIFPSWDNTARRRSGATILVNSTPEKYSFWMAHLAYSTLERFCGDEQMIFVNAWNEWAEGCHLEPDQEHGLRYLEAGRDAVAFARQVDWLRQRLGPDTEGAFAYREWYEGVEAFLSAQAANCSESGRAMYGLLAYQMLSAAGPGVQQQLQRLLASRDEQLSRMSRSASWKITAPLRKLGDLLAAIRAK